MTSQPGYQTIAILVLSDISRSKDNQTMKFGQLIENNKNLFLKKKRLRHRCFPVNFAKFLRTAFLTEHLQVLLLISARLKRASFFKDYLPILQI